jgi:PKD repeat protein
LNDTAVSGATGSTWAFVPSSAGSYSVYLNVTDSTGVTAKSNVIAIAVNPAPSVTVLPVSSGLNVGQLQLFTSEVSNGTSPFTYQWCLNGSSVSGATGSTWAFVPSSAGSYSVYLNVTDSVGDRVKSNTATVTVSAAIPEFTPAFALPLFIVATLMIVIVQERKHGDNRQRALRESL